MNKDLAKKLIQIQAKTNKKEDYKKLFIKKNVFEQEEVAVREAVKDKRIPKDIRKKLYEHLEKGHFHRETLEINQDMAKKIDKRMEESIKDNIRSGYLPKYNLDKDPQAKKWLEKIKNKK